MRSGNTGQKRPRGPSARAVRSSPGRGALVSSPETPREPRAEPPHPRDRPREIGDPVEPRFRDPARPQRRAREAADDRARAVGVAAEQDHVLHRAAEVARVREPAEQGRWNGVHDEAAHALMEAYRCSEVLRRGAPAEQLRRAVEPAAELLVRDALAEHREQLGRIHLLQACAPRHTRPRAR